MRSILVAAALWSTACNDGPLAPCAYPDAAVDTLALMPWPVDPDSGLRYRSLGPVPPLPEWEDNEATEARHQLGQSLFADARLSSSGTVTCGNCHSPVGYFQSNTPRDLPARSLPELTPNLPRHTPSLLNVVYAKQLHWDGSENDLYEAMVLPLAEPNMNLTDLPRDDVWTLDVTTAKARLRTILTEQVPGYVPLFEAAYDVDLGALDADAVWLLAGKALAVYMRAAVSRDAPFDAWNAGDDDAISPEAIAGFEVFVGKGACVNCHGGPLFTDYSYHNLSLLEYDDDGDVVDPGRARVTGKPEDLGKFLTPSLRHVNKTSPFFHNGAEAVLYRVIEHHAGPASRVDDNHDPLLELIGELDHDDIAHLIAFLKTLEGAPLDLPNLNQLPPLPE